jgi:hypothetical protein
MRVALGGCLFFLFCRGVSGRVGHGGLDRQMAGSGATSVVAVHRRHFTRSPSCVVRAAALFPSRPSVCPVPVWFVGLCQTLAYHSLVVAFVSVPVFCSVPLLLVSLSFQSQQQRTLHCSRRAVPSARAGWLLAISTARPHARAHALCLIPTRWSGVRTGRFLANTNKPTPTLSPSPFLLFPRLVVL